MLTGILSILSSSGLGVLFGHLFGWLNRREDARIKLFELEHQTKRWAHELLMRDKDRELLQTELTAQAQIASIELEGKLAEADALAVAAAHQADKAAYGGGFVDVVRGLVRPTLTGLLVIGALAVNAVLLSLLVDVWPSLDMESRLKLMLLAMEWLFFQAGSAIGFWFGSRGQPRVRGV